VPPEIPPTRDSLREFVAMMRAAFPDFRYEVFQQTQDGDTHVGYVRASGTMTGDFMGMPASGRKVEVEAINIYRVVDGKFAEGWGEIDTITLLTQLGAMGAPS